MTRDSWVEMFDSLGNFLDITKLYLTLSASRTVALSLSVSHSLPMHCIASADAKEDTKCH